MALCIAIHNWFINWFKSLNRPTSIILYAKHGIIPLSLQKLDFVLIVDKPSHAMTINDGLRKHKVYHFGLNWKLKFFIKKSLFRVLETCWSVCQTELGNYVDVRVICHQGPSFRAFEFSKGQTRLSKDSGLLGICQAVLLLLTVNCFH